MLEKVETNSAILNVKVAEKVASQEAQLIEENIKLKQLFKKAEKSLKINDRIEQTANIPAINELRYAGYHCITFIDSPFIERIEHLKSAQKHCKRAIYDAVEARITYYLEQVRYFKEDFKEIALSNTVKDYQNIQKIARKANKIINLDNSNKGKEKYYDELSKYSDELEEAYYTLEDARDELNKVLKKHKNEEQNRSKHLRYKKINIWMPLLTAAIGGLVAYILN